MPVPGSLCICHGFRFVQRVQPAQARLFPDARPLVERLGRDFFLQVPAGPGVYLMRGAGDQILYVGKARDLRRRLASYRVANPERLPRRLLRLLRNVERIEWEPCLDEPAALAREAALLLSLKPRFNRAGVWPATPRFLLWRAEGDAMEFTIQLAGLAGWQAHGPMGAVAGPLRAAWVRLLWHGLQPQRGLLRMPPGWFHGRLPATARVAAGPGGENRLGLALAALTQLAQGSTEALRKWGEMTASHALTPALTALLAEDLQTAERLARFPCVAPVSEGGPFPDPRPFPD